MAKPAIFGMYQLKNLPHPLSVQLNLWKHRHQRYPGLLELKPCLRVLTGTTPPQLQNIVPLEVLVRELQVLIHDVSHISCVSFGVRGRDRNTTDVENGCGSGSV